MHVTTRQEGFELLIKSCYCIVWKDKSTSWESLSDMKESYPVEVAEYTEAMGISGEPAFSCWTAHVLKKR